MDRLSLVLLSTGIFVTVPVGAFASTNLAASVVFVHGRIWTGPPGHAEAQAMAVWNGRLLAVGTEIEIRPFVGPTTTLIDLKGRRVVPGFHDSHLHLLGGGLRLGQVALKDAKDEAEFGARLRQADGRLPRDRWLVGGDWDHDRAFGGTLPTADLLDRYVADRPAFLRRYDGHMALANHRALQLAGINAATADPAGGVIVRRQGGREPSGILRDNAMELVSRIIPSPSQEEIAGAVRAALAEFARNGVTSVEDMDGSDAATRRLLFRHYQELARTGQLTARIDLWWPLSSWEELAKLGLRSGFGDEWVRVGGVKGFMDGSLGSNTAKMFAAYLNEPATTGVFVTPPGVMREYVRQADRAGLAVAVHAIGDQANAEMLDAYADAIRVNGPRDHRFRIEHAQHLRPQDVHRFHELGVIASMQPYHLADDGRWAEGRIGPQRCASSYAYRSLLDAGARLAFGSDWSVAPVSPLEGIDAAVNRRTLDGKHPDGWFPAQRISVAEAIEAYTMGAAYAAFAERDRGSLEAGKFADFTVLSRDILDPSQREHIGAAAVDLTVVAGKVVYDRQQTR